MSESNRTKRLNWVLLNRIPDLVHSLKNRENISISDQQALNCLKEADPSSNYSAVQWLCEAYNREGFLWEDLSGGQTSKVWETLKLFSRYKKHLRQEQRNLYAYKTLTKVYQSVQTFNQAELEQSKNSDEFGSKGNSLKRLEKRKALSDTHILLDQPGLKIVIPLTVEAAQWWGRGTRWCTAAKNNNRFDWYNKDAPLLILLFQDHENRSRKFQLWVTEGKVQWMDEADETVDTHFIQNNWSILEPIVSYMFEQTSNTLKFVPKYLRTQELCKLAVEQNGNMLFYVPDNIKTKELCIKSIEQNAFNLRYVPKDLLTYELCTKAVEQNGILLNYIPEYIPESLISKNLCIKAVEQNGETLCYVPEYLKTKEVCMKAVQKTGNALYLVPNKLRTKELCIEAVQQNGLALKYVPENLKLDEEVYIAACENDGMALQYVPYKLRTKELCLIACKNNGRALQEVPTISWISYLLSMKKYKEIFEQAIGQSGLNLKYVPELFKTLDLCIKACEQNKKAFEYVPVTFRTHDIQILNTPDLPVNILEKSKPTDEQTKEIKWNLMDIIEGFSKLSWSKQIDSDEIKFVNKF